MVHLAIVGDGDKETVIEAISLLKQIPGFKIIFIRQSYDSRLYIVTERVFTILNQDGGSNEFTR